MKYLSAQPATKYYAWQIDVMLHSFVNQGVNLSDVLLVNAIHGDIDPHFEVLKQKYKEANFYFYEDTRNIKHYISSIRPHILFKHFKEHPELSKETIFYHDCDIVLTRPLNVDLLENGAACYLSDTISYIGYDYIISKGQDVFEEMTNACRIDPELVIKNQENSGGAQYVLKNINEGFWLKVEADCQNMYYLVSRLSAAKRKENPDYHDIQIWCADMWAVLWNLWKEGKQTLVISELDFMFATDPIENWNSKAIYHNAGVTSASDGLFYKGNYINQFPIKDLVIDNTKASYKYYEIIKECL